MWVTRGCLRALNPECIAVPYPEDTPYPKALPEAHGEDGGEDGGYEAAQLPRLALRLVQLSLERLGHLGLQASERCGGVVLVGWFQVPGFGFARH